MNVRIATAWYTAAMMALGLAPQSAARRLTGDIATYVKLPSLSSGPSEALAVDRSGTFAVGYGWDKHGNLRAVEWIFQNGAWSITSLQPLPATTGALARG